MGLLYPRAGKGGRNYQLGQKRIDFKEKEASVCSLMAQYRVLPEGPAGLTAFINPPAVLFHPQLRDLSCFSSWSSPPWLGFCPLA